MTNEERYQRAFAPLHASAKFMEVKTMNKPRKRYIPRAAVVCAAVVLVLALAAKAIILTSPNNPTGCIYTKENLDQIHAVLRDKPIFVLCDDVYRTLTYTDGQGQTRERGGGGIVMEADGSERPLTEAEIVEQLNAPEVEYGADGSVTVWWRGQKLDITDKFQGKVCYVKLTGGRETVYLTVKYQGGYGWSNEDYPDPNDFYAE